MLDPNDAPYQLSRSDLRRRYGARAIKSYGPENNPLNSNRGRFPGSEPGMTAKPVWDAFFHPTSAVSAPNLGQTNINPDGTTTSFPNDNRVTSRFLGGKTNPTVQTPIGQATNGWISTDQTQLDSIKNKYGARSATSSIDLAPSNSVQMQPDYLQEILNSAPPPIPQTPLQKTSNSIAGLAAPSVWDVPIDDDPSFF